jgi:hypothetical protein
MDGNGAVLLRRHIDCRGRIYRDLHIQHESSPIVAPIAGDEAANRIVTGAYPAKVADGFAHDLPCALRVAVVFGMLGVLGGSIQFFRWLICLRLVSLLGCARRARGQRDESPILARRARAAIFLLVPRSYLTAAESIVATGRRARSVSPLGRYVCPAPLRRVPHHPCAWWRASPKDRLAAL